MCTRERSGKSRVHPRRPGPPDTLAGAPSDVIEFWRGVVGAVFEQVVIKRAGKGPRFSPERVQLIPREGYEGVVWPDPKRG